MLNTVMLNDLVMWFHYENLRGGEWMGKGRACGMEIELIRYPEQNLELYNANSN